MILPKNKLNHWLAALKKHDLFTPTRNGDVVLFSPFSGEKDVILEGRPTLGPKGILFPQTETLFTYRIGKNAEIVDAADKRTKRIIFGIRPCDARAFSVLDNLFKDEYQDTYYLNAREATTLVGLTCSQPNTNCFCTSLSGSPGERDDVDILLTDLGDGYYVDIVTEKGQILVDENYQLFSEVSDSDESRKEAIIADAEKSISRMIDSTDLPNKLGKIFESDYWNKTAMKCIGCGTCTYLCPTCYCFDIQDEIQGIKGKRARMWDSCMYPEYTIHTSGHNPRPARMNRIRNRVYHKFKYYHDNFDVHLCIGCGRCVDKCPVNIDIIDIITHVKEGAQ